VRLDAAAIDLGSRVLFFGGENSSGAHNDFQVYDGAAWSTIA
jgi:hypothetical protein